MRAGGASSVATGGCAVCSVKQTESMVTESFVRWQRESDGFWSWLAEYTPGYFQHTVLSCVLTGNQQPARCRRAAMRMVILRPELAAPFPGALTSTPRVPPLNLQPLSPCTLSHTC
jgi:hypothetical protein